MKSRSVVNAVIAVLAALCFTGSNCRTPTDPTPTPRQRNGCELSCGSTLTYSAKQQSIGDFLHLGMGDQMWPVTDCGGAFAIYNGHAGGYGDTLQIVGCGNSFYLVWAYDSLQIISLGLGWYGTTDRGARIGNTLAEVRAAYPDGQECDPGNSYYLTAYCVRYTGMSRLLFNIDKSGRTSQIQAWYTP